MSASTRRIRSMVSRIVQHDMFSSMAIGPDNAPDERVYVFVCLCVYVCVFECGGGGGGEGESSN